MKKIFISLLLPFSMLLSWQLPAQIRIDWQQCYGSLGEDRPYVITGTDSGIRVAGSCGADNGLVSLELSSDRGWILDIDPQGNLTSQQNPGFLPVGIIKAQDASSDSYIMGYSNNALVSYYHNISVVRQDASGNVKFERTLSNGSSFNLFPDMGGQGIQATHDGGVVGYCSIASDGGDVSTYYGGWCAWLFKLGASGEMLWEITLGTEGDEYASGLLATSDNTLLALVSGKPSGNGSLSGCDHDAESFDSFVVRLDQNGNVLGVICYGGSGNERLCQAIELDDGYLFLGTTTSNDGDLMASNFHEGGGNQQNLDVWLLRTDHDGNVLWSKCHGGSGTETAVKAFPNSDGGFTVFGSTDSSDGDVVSAASLHDTEMPSMQHVWCFRTDSIGELLWERVIGIPDIDTPLCDVLRHDDKHYTLAAQSWSMDGHVSGDYLCSNDTILTSSHQNFWVLHISDTYSNSDLTEQTEPIKAIKVCPNPADDVLHLELSPDAVPTLVELYDIQGRHVMSQRSGFGSIVTKGLPVGVYTIKVTLEGGKSYSDTIIKN